MGLIYECDDCEKTKRGNRVPGIHAEVGYILPRKWRMRSNGWITKVLCGKCFNK